MKKNVVSSLPVAILSFVLIFGFTTAYAEEQYRAEITPEYLRQDFDDNSSATAAGINGEVFFAPVNTEGHPYAEAAFLERIGSAFFSAARIYDTGGFVKADGMLYGVGVNFAKPGFPYAVLATYGVIDEEITEPAAGDFKSHEYRLRIGHFLIPTLLAGVEYDYIKTDVSVTGFTGSSIKRNNYGFFARYAHELQGGRELSFEGTLQTRKRNDGTETLTNADVRLNVDYFFNRSLSAGAGIANNSGKYKADEGMTYAARVLAFFTPRFSAAVTYERFLNSNAGETNDRTIDTTLSARF